MAFQALQVNKNGGKNGQVPFISDWIDSLEEVPYDTLFPCSRIRRGIKGLMLYFGDFCVFVFKSNEIHDYLLEAVEAWHLQQKSPSLLLKITDEYGGFELGVDKELLCEWSFLDRKTYIVNSKKATKSKDSKPAKNPFLD